MLLGIIHHCPYANKSLKSWHGYLANVKYLFPKYFKWLVTINFYKIDCNHINPNSAISL